MKRTNTRKVLLSVLASLFGVASFNAQVMLKEIPLSQQIESSGLVVEGKVISKESFWNADQTNIYTINTVEVYKIFKGNPVEIVQVITTGGTVGNMSQKVSPSLNLNANDVGIFTLASDVNVTSNGFRPYSGVQGFYKYDLNRDVVINPFNKREGIETLYTEILSKTKADFSEVLKYNVAEQANKAAKSAKVLAPASISFTDQPVSAGTKTVLTINGTGFGSVKGGVGFANSSDGGASVTYALDSQVLTWTDERITVEIPSLAGTGLVTIVDSNNDSSVSEEVLIVSFALLTNENAGKAYPVQYYGANGNGGLTWSMSTDLSSNSSANLAFMRAFETWRCETGINWGVSANTTTQNSAGLDAENVIAFSPNLPEGYLGATTVYYDSCNASDWVVAEVDVIFDGKTDWFYAEDGFVFGFDFETVALHELGHAQLLDHVIDESDPMHFNIQSFIANHELSDSNKEAANIIVTNSTTNAVCSYQLMSGYSCLLGIEEDVLESGVDLYPNPAKTEFFIKKSVSINLEFVIIYDVNGRLISKHDVSKTSGLQTISLSGISKGLYFVNISSDLASITKKLIVD
ncbi:T9SS type A sorting domain-containing protein [Algibacter sp. L4_22]|uniref:T9SS type A sorting domain-containing protein n=1 Tax=Algibacter sp. L4_22 TaxID=2942477 RepID=UPI00201B8917|nr:T9SS type A sorting domain-containing protein [Algibacter sp. L4_22]MCL5127438.1 T9SS type A sorting domain-containing protein [Algibacter sp. L4_22]